MASLAQNAITFGAGYTCGFIEQPPKLFACEICKLVLRHPQLTQCCGQNVCRPCIAKQAENGEPCPVPACGNQQYVKVVPNRDLEYDILKSRVYCTWKESGCEWVGTLEHINKHLNQDCPFLEVECPNSCGKIIQRQMVKEHEVICERYPVECGKCGSTYQRRHLLSHLDVCPFTKVKCPFCIVGCTTEVLNKNLQKHVDESFPEHRALVVKHSQDVQAEIRENILLIRAKEIQKLLLAQSMKLAGLDDEVVVAKGEMVELQRTLNEARLEFNDIQLKHDLVKAEIEQLLGENEATLRAVRKERDQLFLKSMERCYGPALPQIRPGDIISRPLHCPVTATEYIPHISYKIHRFNEERKNDTYLLLPPFYTHSGGYKMCMSVYCNGYGGFKGEAVSVELRMLSGKYDEHLEWPLNCNVEVEVQDAFNVWSSSKTIIKVNAQSPAPIDRHIAPRFGSCQHILKLGGLPNRKLSSYLTDGCLTINVINVTFNRK